MRQQKAGPSPPSRDVFSGRAAYRGHADEFGMTWSGAKRAGYTRLFPPFAEKRSGWGTQVPLPLFAGTFRMGRPTLLPTLRTKRLGWGTQVPLPLFAGTFRMGHPTPLPTLRRKHSGWGTRLSLPLFAGTFRMGHPGHKPKKQALRVAPYEVRVPHPEPAFAKGGST